jgi:hypothetical protein
MKYFKFFYEVGLAYSPDWHGTRDKDFPAKVLLYHDGGGFGIGQTEAELSPDVEEMTEKEAMAEIDAYTYDLEELQEDVFVGQNLADRWLPEAVIGDKAIEETEDISKAVFCPICHKFIIWLSDSIQEERVILTCPDGHRVVLNG